MFMGYVEKGGEKFPLPVCSSAAQAWVVNSQQQSGCSIFLLPFPGSKSHPIAQAVKRRIITLSIDFLPTQEKHNAYFFNCTIDMLIKRRNVNQGVSGKKPKTITKVKK